MIGLRDFVNLFTGCFLISSLVLFISACKINDPIIGIYTLEVEGIKNVTSGKLDIIGQESDYFGKLTFNSLKPRIYEVGLEFGSKDSLAFRLPGNGGFLRLKRQDSTWSGSFKYFGLNATVKATRTGDAADSLQALAVLRPLAPGIISTEAEESFPCFDNPGKTLYFTRNQKYSSAEI